ncbi:MULTISPECIES: Gfo/Idh/MocA family protein [unclassified Nocardioides]|uniref:Gfo/Idh/MocA family protein n=1 Tax=unclassified Nocardioides TaxID=2615069 RepID=UPI0036078A67
MRFGLVGTGPWADMAHGPGLLAAEGVELVGVWGRSPERARALATGLGASAHDDYEALLAEVDAVAFAVPPEVQAELALVAARSGKHLLLDKPVAMTVAAAHELRDAAASAGVASVVFFTDRFATTSRAWLREVRESGGWQGGWLRLFGSLQEPGNPFGSSPWRRESGALWDIGPHALSTLSAALGPVRSLTAVGGEGDLVTLVVRHDSGATSTATLTLFAPPAAAGSEAAVWGDAGLSAMPARPDRPPSEPLAVAAEELVRSARTGEPHEIDVAFGARIVELLADAQAQIDAARRR